VYKAINWQVIFLIARAISMGTAMESTGTAKLRQNNYLDYLEIGPDCIVVYTLFFKFLTEIITNSATAVLLLQLLFLQQILWG
jgi:di/tricarboxylate transporter